MATISNQLMRAIARAERKGLTRYAIARRAGVSRMQVGRIARGESIPTVELAQRIARAIGYQLVLRKER